MSKNNAACFFTIFDWFALIVSDLFDRFLLDKALVVIWKIAYV